MAFIRRLNSLEKFQLELYDSSESDRIVPELTGQWKSSSCSDLYGRAIVKLDRQM